MQRCKIECRFEHDIGLITAQSAIELYSTLNRQNLNTTKNKKQKYKSVSHNLMES